ncbi:hypothetical protein DESUT3_33180 [Desulfuromonas versatilis]|uniref:Cobalt ECF transporter T component CbiQ n=1 Tax=Desulfuromonas versatilis TaxID=2802975 RepID=A0ABM8HW66_9BACT|nr:cobalt ECF transporter T component CbiQ [Desulfuromonas versatilis]BCR06249.1 hypothetical protein DESUT3_33180 [Desulfuromonas versatilis]
MTEVARIALPLWQILLLLVPPALLAAALAGLRYLGRSRRERSEERDWSVPALVQGSGNSPFHRWDVRCKLATLLGYAFMVASLQQLPSALAAVALSAAALAVARTPLPRVLLRLLAVCGFLGMLLVVMPFSAPAHPGDTLLIFGGLEGLGFNLRGLQLAGTIAAKGVAIALLSEPLFATAPLPVTLHGLARLGAPEMVGQMVLLSHRYLHVFRHEAQRMAAGMQVRGFRKRTSVATLQAVANFLGMLFVRSFERTERVFEAMQARGYRGRFPEPAELRLRRSDLLLGAACLALGITLVAFDRLWF